MTPDVYDVNGVPYHGPERRAGEPRRDDDTLAPAVLLGYELWAGRVWKHRGKIGLAFVLFGSVVGWVGGHWDNVRDMDDVKDRLARVEAAQEVMQQNESAKMNMLCSLTRRIDPLGLPLECGPPQLRPKP